MTLHSSAPPATLPVDVPAVFGLTLPWAVSALADPDEHVPVCDAAFRFEPAITRALLAGFAHNRRVYVHGPHGSGKSSHIEQVAARLNWPCVRINLDGHVTRADLIGRDMVRVQDGKQITEFVPGMLVWALQRPMALILDEYDAGRPDVMFVIQRLLEANGKLTLLDQNRVIEPHPAFRLFATANTAGHGDASGLYAGTYALNQAQMDRWHIIMQLDYLPAEQESAILAARLPQLDQTLVRAMVTLAHYCRRAFADGELSVLLSLRSLISWGENTLLLGDQAEALRWVLWNRCDDHERQLLAELYQRCFAAELLPSRGSPV